MVLELNNDHIIHFHLNATLSMDLAQTYCVHPDYLVVQCWVHATYLSPDTVKQTSPQTFITLSSLWAGWTTHLFTACVITSWL